MTSHHGFIYKCMYVWQEGCGSVAHTLDKIDLFVEMNDSVVDSDDV